MAVLLLVNGDFIWNKLLLEPKLCHKTTPGKSKRLNIGAKVLLLAFTLLNVCQHPSESPLDLFVIYQTQKTTGSLMEQKMGRSGSTCSLVSLAEKVADLSTVAAIYLF